MPTPYGSRGGMAFSADELRVLRRALAIALHPESVPRRPGPERDEEVRECLRLAEAVDEAAREGGRLRAFLLADLARYRAALPGAVTGYAERLQDALAAGYRPGADDLAALRRLCAAPAGREEAGRRRALLARCERLAEQDVRIRLADRGSAHDGALAGRGRLLALPGGRASAAPGAAGPDPKPKPAPGPDPAAPKPDPKAPKGPGTPGRPVPTPGEVFPPRRKPTPPGAVRGPEARPA
ncbi:hypothetical protein [Streptomyces albireticuli]|uniref:Uncharacterized protein n=1 Tax=Streptomyces albireticuli TaxID=1940 RepID=A0A2A2DB87_9ACTN|nr:hypothetical protein [Streptomyces albireticuli]MCD9145278.1 hypothetical protein [Streptomyces albireticuli]MCD9164547.1 hypothetical protein [Streptomyces albireticuli]MCD9194812.1 hypothetical protein [Streptomyces albireticuli]PAU49753.1 hypothetical protein CK936_06230 [Streptomyces albireticuli]